MSDELHLLAVVPDSNAAIKFRHLQWHNPETIWDCVTIRDDATTQLFDWTRAGGAHHLCMKDRWTTDFPQTGTPLPGLPELAYERAVRELDVPMVGHYLHYTDTLPSLCEVLEEMLGVWGHDQYDAVVMWNSHCWYNQLAKMWARDRELPMVFCERTALPGMFIVDGTGLEAGHSDLSLYRDVRVGTEALRGFISAATLTGVEQQRLTTPAEVYGLLRGKPTVFVPLQMPFDTNMVFRAESGVDTNEKLLEWVAQQLVPGYQVVVKQHPSDWFTEPERLRAKCEELGFLLVDFATHPLLEQVHEIVTINSQTAVEAWMHEVPVTFLGQPSFQLEGLSGTEMLQVLRWGYYVEPAGFTQRVREIIERGPVTT